MSGINSENSTRLSDAEHRLAQAIGRLEAALDTKAQNISATDPALVDELSRLQSENGELRTLVGGASARLDATIAKLKTQMAG